MRSAYQWFGIPPDLVRPAILVGAVIMFLAPWLFGADTAIVSPTELGTDLVTKQWPNAAYIVRNWHAWGEIPLWRTTGMGGVPIMGNPSMLLGYPPYWLVFLFPIGWAFTLYFALHLVWMGWGVFGLAKRVFRMSPNAALLAALSAALSAKVVSHLGGGHIDVIAAVAWLPWFWLAADELARQPGWLSIVGTGVAAAAQALTHLPTLWLGVLLVASWWLYMRLADRATGALKRCLWSGLAGVGAIVLSLGLSAAHIWPMLEMLPYTTRTSLTLAEAGQYALPTPLLIGLILPPALAFPEWVIYVGVVTLALAPVSWLARSSAKGWGYLIGLVVVGILISLGRATPVYPVLFRLLPGMRWLRVPPRVMFLVQLALALLSGVGWDAIAQLGTRRRPALLLWWIALGLLIALGALWAWRYHGVLAISGGFVAVAVVTLAFVMAQAYIPAIRLGVPMALAICVLLEAVALAPQFIARGQMSDVTMATSVVRFLKSQKGPFRVYSPRGLVSLAQAVVHQLETADGNDPFQFDHYVRWMNAASGCGLEGYSVSVPACAGNELDSQAYLQARPDWSLLGVGNVRYVITNHVLAECPSLVRESDAVRICENTAMLPRAFVVPTVTEVADDVAALAILRSRGPTATATVAGLPDYASPVSASYRAARVIGRKPNRIEVQAEGPGWLVLSETWAPAWRATVDGQQTEVIRTDVAFCGLQLPEGMHTVTLAYVPTGWVWGRWISLSTLAVAIVWTTVVLARRLCCVRDDAQR